MGVVKNIMVRAIADFSGLINGSQRASNAIRNMGNSMHGSTTMMGRALDGVGGKLAALAGIYVSFEFLKSATSDAIKFDAAMETLNNRMGASAVQFNYWADTTGKAMGYSKLQIAEYGNTFSNMLYDAATDQEDLAKKTSKFMEASAIVRSKTGLSQEEVSKRMRSAMNMEADGADELGVNVRATAVEQSAAFKSMAGGVKNFSDLASGMQKNIMYTYLLEEVTRRYGSTVSGNAATQTAIFVASLKDLALHLGQAFLPIWTTVVPALTNMVNWLDRTAQQVAKFMRVMFGYSATDTTKSAQDSTQAFKGQASAVNGLADAHDKLKKAKAGVAGFDEVNILADPEKEDAVSGLGGDAEKAKALAAKAESNKRNQPEMDDIDSTSGPVGLANKLKAAFEDGKIAWENLKNSIKEHSDIIISSLVAIGAVFLVLFGPAAIAAMVGWTISFVASMVPVIASAWSAAIAMLAVEWPILVIIAAIALLAFGITMLVLHWKEVKEWAGKVWDGIVVIWGKVAKWFDDVVITPFMKSWNSFWSDLAKGWNVAWDGIVDIFVGAATWFYDNVIKPVVDFFVAMGTDIGTAAVNSWNQMIDAFKTAGTWFKTNVIDVVVEKFGSLKELVKTKATEAWTSIKEVFGEVETWFQTNVVSRIVSAFENIKNGFAKGFKDGLIAVFNEVVGLLNTAIGAFNRVKNGTGVGKLIPDVPDIPKLAKGGITNGPMMALIGDNTGGQEVVSPLSDLMGMVSTAVSQAMAFSSQSRSSAPSGDIVLNIDGRAFARITNPYAQAEQARVGGSNVTLSTI